MRIVTTAVALLGAAGIVSGCNSPQPSPGCQVQDGTWQAAYFLKNPADASKSCGTIKGERLGVYKYLTPSFVTPQPANPRYMAIRPSTAAGLTAFTDKSSKLQPRVTVTGTPDPTTDPTGALLAGETATAESSTLPEDPDSKTGLCLAQTFNNVTVAARAVAATETKTGTALAARTVSYQFSNVNVYSAASAPGTQLEGTLVYGDGTGCTAEYRVVAMWPPDTCTSTADCLDPTVVANPINPDFDVVCLPGIGPGGAGGCVPNPDKSVPALKP